MVCQTLLLDKYKYTSVANRMPVADAVSVAGLMVED